MLSGAVGTFLAWGKNFEERKHENDELRFRIGSVDRKSRQC